MDFKAESRKCYQLQKNHTLIAQTEIIYVRGHWQLVDVAIMLSIK